MVKSVRNWGSGRVSRTCSYWPEGASQPSRPIGALCIRRVPVADPGGLLWLQWKPPFWTVLCARKPCGVVSEPNLGRSQTFFSAY